MSLLFLKHPNFDTPLIFLCIRQYSSRCVSIVLDLRLLFSRYCLGSTPSQSINIGVTFRGMKLEVRASSTSNPWTIWYDPHGGVTSKERLLGLHNKRTHQYHSLIAPILYEISRDRRKGVFHRRCNLLIFLFTSDPGAGQLHVSESWGTLCNMRRTWMPRAQHSTWKIQRYLTDERATQCNRWGCLEFHESRGYRDMLNRLCTSAYAWLALQYAALSNCADRFAWRMT